MEVIIEGFLPQEQMMEGTCTYCHCMIRGKRSEWTKEEYSDFRESYTYFTTPCPTKGCGRTITGRNSPPRSR